MEYGNITCIGLLSAFQHCYTNPSNPLILLPVQARVKKRFQTLRKKQNNCDKSRECTLCKHPSTQVLMQPFQFLTLELWSPVAIGSKKQNDLRRVWQIQFDRFPHKTDFVFFLPMLCNQISSQDHNYQGVLSKNGDMDQYLRTDHMFGNWGSMRSCPFDKSCFFFISENKTNIANGKMDLGVQFFHQSNCF